MKTISQKIATSFLRLIIISLLVIMLLFNIAVRIYSHSMAQKELKNTVENVEILIRQRFSLDDQNQRDIETMLDNLKLIRGMLRISSLSSSIEYMIVDAKGQIRFPLDFSDSFLSYRVVEKAVETVEGKEPGRVYSFRSTGIKYYVISKSFSNNRVPAFKLVFISGSSGFWGFVRVINIILLSIIALAIAFGSYVAVKLSKSITKPISDLSKYAKEIGQGKFVVLPTDESSAEINDLTNNMNDMSKRLMDYDRTQKMFLQNASHEIRTPLMSIQGYAEGISKGIFSDTAKTAEIICEESKRLNSLVENLLTLSRIENNTYEQELSAINLSDNIKEYIQKITGYTIKENKILKLNIKDNNLTVNANDTLLSTAVINIVSNCIKYARSEIEVSLFKQGDYAIIRIKDDGEGISKKDLSYIFDRFYKGKNGNFGLGLSIAKSAVEVMSGNIKAYNDNGAVFEIELPLLT
ncbi:MAG: HAMP domain-containing sensor histidine kinase [Eubacteriales bacterium]|nr:HAMP domain-containing sensor histidine kinase [Eubacteriales bacterium]